MLLRRNTSLLWMCLIACFALGVYFLKYDVHSLQQENRQLERQIREEKLAMQLLEAEWVYLNRPQRLQALAEQFLSLQAIAPKAMMQVADLPPLPDALPLQHAHLSTQER
jgi:cell division protein FtsL